MNEAKKVGKLGDYQRCMFCRRPTRITTEVRAILGPPGEDGQRLVIGWAHDRCFDRETGRVLQDLRELVPHVRKINRQRAEFLQFEVAALIDRYKNREDVFSSLTILLTRLTRELADEVIENIGRSVKAVQCYAVIDGLVFLGKMLYQQTGDWPMVVRDRRRRPTSIERQQANSR